VGGEIKQAGKGSGSHSLEVRAEDQNLKTNVKKGAEIGNGTKGMGRQNGGALTLEARGDDIPCGKRTQEDKERERKERKGRRKGGKWEAVGKGNKDEEKAK
jgi:hypothetical protein